MIYQTRFSKLFLRQSLTLALTLSLTGAFLIAPAHADDGDVDAKIEALLGDPVVFRTAITDLQARVANTEKVAVADMLNYPITVRVDGQARTLEKIEDLADVYDEVITPEIADVIINQKYGDLFVNGDGVMFGKGQIWMAAICLDDKCAETEVRVTAIQSVE